MKIIITKTGNFERAYTMAAFKKYLKSLRITSFEPDFSDKDAFKNLKEVHDKDYGDSFEIIGTDDCFQRIYLKCRRVTLRGNHE